MNLANELLDQVERLQNNMVAHATGHTSDNAEYRDLRLKLMQNPATQDLLPSFVRRCSDLDQFWGWIKYEKKTYQERRNLIWQGFSDLRAKLELERVGASLDTSTGIFSELNEAHVAATWQKAMERRANDPEGAITTARTLIESTCKIILDDLAVEHGNKDDLPKLWRKTASALQLSPDQHSERVFKEILGGCQSVVNGLGSVRNRVGDAHGQGRSPVRPAPRHAELCVNLAGSMAAFVVQTWKASKNNQ